MALTIVGIDETYPLEMQIAFLQVKREWTDEWRTCQYTNPVRAKISAAADDLDTLVARQRMAETWKPPGQNAFGKHDPDYTENGYWIRLLLFDIGDESKSTLWMGRISGKTCDIRGASAHGWANVTDYTCYGPMQILRKTHISTSWWAKDDGGVELGWLPGINDAHEGRLPKRGNRSDEKVYGTYLYGGHEMWTNFDYAEYLISMLNIGDGPKWYLGGQAAVLKDLSETVRLPASASAWHILRELIPTKYGLDFCVRPAAEGDGFVIWVYSLAGDNYSYGSKTLPKNPDEVQIEMGSSPQVLRDLIVYTDDHRYSKLRVIGSRIVVCRTLEFGSGPVILSRDLQKGWTAADETAYKAGDGTKTGKAKAHDIARGEAKYKQVFQTFVATSTWGNHAKYAAPRMAGPGKPPGDPEIVEGDYQSVFRSTLHWLPLQVGWKYGPDLAAPVDGNTEAKSPEYLPTALWLGAPLDKTKPSDLSYIPAELLGLHCSALSHDLGVQVNCSPNHLMALNHWIDGSAPAPTRTPPKWDYENIVATVAFHADERLQIERSMVPEEGRPQAGVMVIEVHDAELWLLAPETVVSTEKGKLVRTLSGRWMVLRNDVAKLELAMAGAICRYLAGRTRGEITAEGIWDWGELLGQMLRKVRREGMQGAQSPDIPITCVEWFWPESGPARTVLHSGYAR
jgi:hypothetical protein